MRLVLMGTGPFAVPSFESVRASGQEIAAVVSRPEIQTANAKKAPPPSPVRLWAESHGLKTLSPDSMNSLESVEWLTQEKPDLLFVCDYGQILSKECLASARLGGINLHGSLLPRHRGAAPVQWSILSGDSMAGVSVIHMTPGLDAGPVIAAESTKIDARENGLDLERRLSELGVSASLSAIASLSSWSPGNASLGTIQDKALATKAPRLSKSDGMLDPRYPVRFMDRQVRGLFPWPGCFAVINVPQGPAIRLILHRGRPYPIPLDRIGAWLPSNLDCTGHLLYGDRLKSIGNSVEDLSHADLALVARDGLYVLEVVQPAGKKQMSAAEFVRGYAKMDWMRVEVSDGPHPLLERMQSMEMKS